MREFARVGLASTPMRGVGLDELFLLISEMPKASYSNLAGLAEKRMPSRNCIMPRTCASLDQDSCVN